jgi:hypothetical protein
MMLPIVVDTSHSVPGLADWEFVGIVRHGLRYRTVIAA